MLPAAILGSCAGALIAFAFTWMTQSIVPSRLDLIWSFLLTYLSSGWAFVAAGVYTAPTHKAKAAVGLGIVGAILGGLAVVGGFLGENTWIDITKALIGSGATVATAFYAYKNDGL